MLDPAADQLIANKNWLTEYYIFDKDAGTAENLMHHPNNLKPAHKYCWLHLDT